MVYLVPLKVMEKVEDPMVQSESVTSKAVPGRPALKFDRASRKPTYKTNRICEVWLPTQVTPEMTSKPVVHLCRKKGDELVEDPVVRRHKQGYNLLK